MQGLHHCGACKVTGAKQPIPGDPIPSFSCYDRFTLAYPQGACIQDPWMVLGVETDVMVDVSSFWNTKVQTKVVFLSASAFRRKPIHYPSSTVNWMAGCWLFRWKVLRSCLPHSRTAKIISEPEFVSEIDCFEERYRLAMIGDNGGIHSRACMGLVPIKS